jgi:hypothetical protein
MPGQVYVTKGGTEGVEEQHCDNRDGADIIQKLNMFLGTIHFRLRDTVSARSGIRNPKLRWDGVEARVFGRR